MIVHGLEGVEAEELQDKIKALTAELEEWHACARYDAMMEGPRFKGWDRSQMERCRKKYLEKE